MTHLFRQFIKTIVFILGLNMFSIISISAQQNDVPINHVVYLRDGSVFKGSIIEENDDYIYMVILDGTTIDIAQWRVKKVLSNENYLFHSGGRYHYSKDGIFWNLQIGFSPGDKVSSEHTGLEIGYRLKKRWSVALGLGSEFTTSPAAGFDVSTMFTSLYLYNRNYLTDSRQRPFVYQRIGYGFGPESEEGIAGRHSGGPHAQIGAGIHFASRRRARFILSLGYHTQYTNGEQTYLDNFQHEIQVAYRDYFVHHFIFKFGVEFK